MGGLFFWGNFTAKIDLIRGSLTGSLGRYYASHTKNADTLKRKPLPKRNLSNSQKENLLAFTALNRLASRSAESFWSSLGLTAQGMTRHNAIAKSWKIMIAGGKFDPLKFSAVVLPDPRIKIFPPIQESPGKVIKTGLILSPGYAPPAGSRIHALAFDTEGFCGPGLTTNFSEIAFFLAPPVPQERAVFVLLFCSCLHAGKVIKFGGNVAQVAQRNSGDPAPLADLVSPVS